MAVMCAERSLVTIFGLNEYLMITGAQIGLREKLRTRQLVKQLINRRNGKGVLNCNCIQGSIVSTEPP